MTGTRNNAVQEPLTSGTLWCRVFAHSAILDGLWVGCHFLKGHRRLQSFSFGESSKYNFVLDYAWNLKSCRDGAGPTDLFWGGGTGEYG